MRVMCFLQWFGVFNNLSVTSVLANDNTRSKRGGDEELTGNVSTLPLGQF